MHYTRDSFDFDNSIGHLVAHLHIAMRKQLGQELADHDLTAPQWITLTMLARGKCATAAEIADKLNQDSSSMTRMLDRLESKGLIQRERSKTDRRVVQLFLTEQGRALVPELMQPLVNAHNRILADFSEADVATLQTLLKRLLVACADEAACLSGVSE